MSRQPHSIADCSRLPEVTTPRSPRRWNENRNTTLLEQELSLPSALGSLSCTEVTALYACMICPMQLAKMYMYRLPSLIISLTFHSSFHTFDPCYCSTEMLACPISLHVLLSISQGVGMRGGGGIMNVQHSPSRCRVLCSAFYNLQVSAPHKVICFLRL